MTDEGRNPVERPRGHVEILPPEDETPSSRRVFYSSGFGTIKVVKLGPLASAAMALGVLVVLLLGFFFLGGALLLLIPISLFLAALAFLSRSFGGRG